MARKIPIRMIDCLGQIELLFMPVTIAWEPLLNEYLNIQSIVMEWIAIPIEHLSSILNWWIKIHMIRFCYKHDKFEFIIIYYT